MLRHAPKVLALGVLVIQAPAGAAEYYVAPTGGNDSGACSMAAPCATVGGAQAKAAAGDTVWIRGGNHSGPSSGLVGVAFSKSGQQNNRIKYFAYQNEIPVFNFMNINPTNRVTGFDITASWIHIRGLEVRGVRQYRAGDDSWGVRIRGSASNNILEALNVHHNEAPGIFISDGANNLVLNCDSHHNYDVLEMGGSGDGFGCHSTNGANNTFSGCRAWYNSDDGFDFINARGGVCIVEKSWAFLNGFIPDTTTAIGNGAGFKAGGFGSPPSNYPNPVPRHVVRQCIAFGNRAQGFYANHHNGGIDFFNNLAFRNPANYNMLADSGFPSNHTIRNNIAMASGTAITNLTGGTDTFNSWTSSLGVTVNSMDFLSVMESEAQAPRQADGSLPNVNFGRLAPGSDLIDKGTDVGLPFAGSAPDLGPFETGLTAGGGGMAGTGGTAGAGGSAGGAAGTGAGGAPGGAGAGGVAAGAGGAPSGGVSGAGATNGGTAGAATGGSAPVGGTAGAATGGSAPVGGTGASGAPAGGTSAGGSATGGTGAATTGGTTAGGAAGGGAVDDPDVPAEDPGCGCRVAGSRTNDASLLLAAALAAATLVGRRRRSRG